MGSIQLDVEPPTVQEPVDDVLVVDVPVVPAEAIVTEALIEDTPIIKQNVGVDLNRLNHHHQHQRNPY